MGVSQAASVIDCVLNRRSLRGSPQNPVGCRREPRILRGRQRCVIISALYQGEARVYADRNQHQGPGKDTNSRARLNRAAATGHPRRSRRPSISLEIHQRDKAPWYLIYQRERRIGELQIQRTRVVEGPLETS